MGDALSTQHAARWGCRDRRAHSDGARYLRVRLLYATGLPVMDCAKTFAYIEGAGG